MGECISPINFSRASTKSQIKKTSPLTRQVFNVNQQIIFIDSSVSDYQTLLGGADPQAEIVILDANRSGIEQITETLAAKQNIEAVHIISHGSEGSLCIGSGVLNG